MNAALIEVSQHWGGSLLRVERFERTRRLSVGAASADFQALLPSPVVLVDRGAVLVPGAAPLVIGPDTDVRVALGGQTFRVRAVDAERAVPRELLKHLDWFFIAVCAATAAFFALIAVAAFVIWLMLRLLVLLIVLIAMWLGTPAPQIPWLMPAPVVQVLPSQKIVAVDLSSVSAPMAPPAPVFFERPTPRPTLTPIPMGEINELKSVRIAKRIRPRDDEMLEMVAVLGVLRESDSGVFAALEGSGELGGVEGGVVMGGLIGTGDLYDEYGGLGVRGVGPGGGGSSVGLGGLGGGSIDRGNTSRTAVNLGADTEVQGDALAPEIIRRVVRSHLSQIRSCYEREIADDPDLSGKIVVSFSIGGNGAVSEARVSSSTMNRDAVESCVVERVRRMRFPAPRDGGTVRVVYPFSFQQI